MAKQHLKTLRQFLYSLTADKKDLTAHYEVTYIDLMNIKQFSAISMNGMNAVRMRVVAIIGLLGDNGFAIHWDEYNSHETYGVYLAVQHLSWTTV